MTCSIKHSVPGNPHGTWQFPSDHLPVGIEVDGIKIFCWNVLNSALISQAAAKKSRGLKDSMIADLNQVIHENGLTRRDVIIAQMIQDMMKQGHLIALQECSEPFLQYLQQRLHPNWAMIRSFEKPRKDQEILLYDTTHLTYQAIFSEVTLSAYPTTQGGRPLQNAYFFHPEGHNLRIINSHIPGRHTKTSRKEFAEYVYQHTEGAITIALGDYNCERKCMVAAYKHAGFSDFHLHSPWKTHYIPKKHFMIKGKRLDHLCVTGAPSSRALSPQEILSEGYHLKEMIDLLNR